MKLSVTTFPYLIEKKHVIVLVISLLIIPLVEGFSLLNIMLRYVLADFVRPEYWSFVISILLLHWLSFVLIYQVTKPHTAPYLGIDMVYLKKKKVYLASAVLVIVLLALFAPDYLYGSTFPDESITLGFLGPISSVERVGFVILSITAGICEEVIFRGYGISVLERLLKNKKMALILSSLSFMSLHGLASVPWPFLVQYFIIGLILGLIYQKYRRLEILIIIHFSLDALVAVMVP